MTDAVAHSAWLMLWPTLAYLQPRREDLRVMDLDECECHQHHDAHKQDHQGDDGWSPGEGPEACSGKPSMAT